LADRCGLPALLREHVKIAAKGGVNAAAKILALVAGVCGADSIEDMDLLRHTPSTDGAAAGRIRASG
jgi:hypothetical protein